VKHRFGSWPDGSPAIWVDGELDMATAPELAEALGPWRDGQRSDPVLRVDLSGLTFIDSSGLRVLLELCMSPGCHQLVLCAPTAQVRRVFELVDLGNCPGLVIDPPLSARSKG
jgi:anti-anti-sigma factor